MRLSVLAGVCGVSAMLLACAPEVDEQQRAADLQTALLRIAVPVRDIETSKHFYEYALGFDAGYEGDITSPWVTDLLQLEAGQTVRFAIMYGADSVGDDTVDSAMIGFLQIENPSLPALQRNEGSSLVAGEGVMAMVTADIDTVHSRLEELGATILFGPTESVSGSESELVFRDPDGVRIHVVQMHK